MTLKLFNKKKGKSNKGQEEMVGFVLIVIIVSVALLILLWFLLRSPSASAVENYQVESFIQASLQYTSSCESEIEFLPLEDLIVSCQHGNACLDGTDSCEILNSTAKDLVKNGWNTNNGSAVKGYVFSIAFNGQESFKLAEGNKTSDYKGAFQDFAKGGENYEVSVKIYY
jgi:hypothetical protein